MTKVYLTSEEAISLLPEEDNIHTFIQMGYQFVGADWNRKEIIDKINNSDFREITGKNAKSLGHGLCVYDKTAKHNDDLLYIETDMKKVEKLEEEIKK